MGYIIQLLLEGDEFESLVHLGVEKVRKTFLFCFLLKVSQHTGGTVTCSTYGLLEETLQTRSGEETNGSTKVWNV